MRVDCMKHKVDCVSPFQSRPKFYRSATLRMDARLADPERARPAPCRWSLLRKLVQALVVLVGLDEAGAGAAVPYRIHPHRRHRRPLTTRREAQPLVVLARALPAAARPDPARPGPTERKLAPGRTASNLRLPRPRPLARVRSLAPRLPRPADPLTYQALSTAVIARTTRSASLSARGWRAGGGPVLELADSDEAGGVPGVLHHHACRTEGWSDGAELVRCIADMGCRCWILQAAKLCCLDGSLRISRDIASYMYSFNSDDFFDAYRF